MRGKRLNNGGGAVEGTGSTNMQIADPGVKALADVSRVLLLNYNVVIMISEDDKATGGQISRVELCNGGFMMVSGLQEVMKICVTCKIHACTCTDMLLYAKKCTSKTFILRVVCVYSTYIYSYFIFFLTSTAQDCKK